MRLARLARRLIVCAALCAACGGQPRAPRAPTATRLDGARIVEELAPRLPGETRVIVVASWRDLLATHLETAFGLLTEPWDKAGFRQAISAHSQQYLGVDVTSAIWVAYVRGGAGAAAFSALVFGEVSGLPGDAARKSWSSGGALLWPAEKMVVLCLSKASCDQLAAVAAGSGSALTGHPHYQGLRQVVAHLGEREWTGLLWQAAAAVEAPIEEEPAKEDPANPSPVAYDSWTGIGVGADVEVVSYGPADKIAAAFAAAEQRAPGLRKELSEYIEANRTADPTMAGAALIMLHLGNALAAQHHHPQLEQGLIVDRYPRSALSSPVIVGGASAGLLALWAFHELAQMFSGLGDSEPPPSSRTVLGVDAEEVNCGAAADHVIELMEQDMDKMFAGMPAQQAEQARAALNEEIDREEIVAECEGKELSREQLQCVMGAMSMEDLMKCDV